MTELSMRTREILCTQKRKYSRRHTTRYYTQACISMTARSGEKILLARKCVSICFADQFHDLKLTKNLNVGQTGYHSTRAALRMLYILSSAFRKKNMTKMDIHWGSYRIHIFVFLTLLRIFVPRLEIIFCINCYFLVCIFKYCISSRVNSELGIQEYFFN